MDTRTCKFCGIEFNKIHPLFDEGTLNEGYCCKFHRKDHEKQLMRDGLLFFKEQDNPLILKNKQYTDKSGETVWFPKDEKPYFDQSFRRTFHSIKEKTEFMNKHGVVSDGSSDLNKKKHQSILDETRYLIKKKNLNKGE